MSEESTEAIAEEKPVELEPESEAVSESEKVTPEAPPKADAATRWTRRVLVLCVITFVYYLIGDRYTPYTSQARVRGHVVPVAPQVSGVVTEVAVGLNETVKAGQVLARIAVEDYELAVTNAKAALAQAGQDVGANTADVASATAGVAEAKATLELAETQAARVEKAFDSGAVSASDRDKARSDVTLGEARFAKAEGALEQARQRMGEAKSDNPKLKSAQAALEDAELDLSRTVLRAPRDGGVTNVRIEQGQYANAGQPLMSFIAADVAWIEAYMRENSIGRIKSGDKVDIVLDVKPGKVFEGTVQSTGYGVNWGNTDDSSRLPRISAPRDWLRDPQRFPVVITFDLEETRGLLREGGQADVVVYTSDNGLLNLVGRSWMRVVSWFSYVQ